MRPLPGPLLAGDAFSIRDQVVLLTGAAGRIGRAVAQVFASNGARLVLSDRDAAPLDTFAAALGDEAGADIVTRVADLRSAADLRALIELAEDRFDGLDTLIHCGALISSRPLEIESDEAFDELFETNVRSGFLLAKHAAPLLEKAGGFGGSVINIASVNAHRALHACPLYAATKAALITMSTTFAAELAEKNIRVNTVSPGIIFEAGGFLEEISRMLQPSYAEALHAKFADEHRELKPSQPLPMQGTGYDVAMACLYLASPAARFVTGADLLVDGGKLHMFDSQHAAAAPTRAFWRNFRLYLRALPDEAWREAKPDWVTRKRKDDEQAPAATAPPAR